MRPRTALTLLIAILTLASALPAVASADAPQVLAGNALRIHASGTDHWDVWACGDVDDDVRAADAVDVLDAKVVPFYTWLSDGRYRQDFRARGRLEADKAGECADEAGRRSAGSEGAVVLQTEHISAGGDECVADQTSLTPCAGQPTVLPGNKRIAYLRPKLLLGDDPHISTVVHELGHALNWPHSFTGRLYVIYDEQRAGVEYDDPFDVMGYERLWGTGDWTKPEDGTFIPKATQVFNRIAAGWVPADAIAIDDGTSKAYSVGPIGANGLQAVIVPTADPRAFLTLEARVRSRFDPVPGEGIVVHAIDQRPAACDLDADVAGCWGEFVRESTAPNQPDSLASLVSVGEDVDVAGVTVSVTARTGDRFTVKVDGGRASFALKPVACLYAPLVCDGGGQAPLSKSG